VVTEEEGSAENSALVYRRVMTGSAEKSASGMEG